MTPFQCPPPIVVGLALCCQPGLAADLLTVHQQALDQDPVYRQSIERRAATKEQAPQALARLLPNLNLTANTSDNTQDISSPQGFGNIGRTDYNTHGYRLKLSQTLFNFNQYLGLGLADTNILIAELEREIAAQELMIRVAERYFDILASNDNLAFSRAETISLERQLAEAKQNFEVGLTPITDVQEAQAGYDRAVATEILARNTLDNAREALHEITNQYPDTLTPLGGGMPLVEPEPADIARWADSSLESNLRVIAAKHHMERAQQEIKIQSSAHYPVLNLVSQYDYNRSGGRFGTARGHITSVGMEFNMPLYQGGLVDSKVQQARAQHNEARSKFQQQRRQSRRMTRQAYLGVISGISQVRALKQALLSSESALHATRSGFEVGTRTAVDVVVAERSVFSSRRDYARARYDYVLSNLRLRQAVGSLNLTDIQNVNAWLDDTIDMRLEQGAESIPMQNSGSKDGG